MTCPLKFNGTVADGFYLPHLDEFKSWSWLFVRIFQPV